MEAGELLNDDQSEAGEAAAAALLLPTEFEAAEDEDHDAKKSLKREKKSSRLDNRQAKKERKLLGTFLQKVLQLKGQQEVEEVTLSQPPPSYRCLLVDNRDFQLRQSTEELLRMIQERRPGSPVIEDCFVMPSKLWTLLRFTTADCLATFRSDLHSSGDNKNSTGITVSSPISDRLYELTVERFLPEVKQILGYFSRDNGAPEGLTVIENFLIEEKEQALIQFAESCFLRPSVVRLKNRSAVHFGHVFDYTANTISSSSKEEEEEGGTNIQVQDRQLPSVVTSLLSDFPGGLPELPDQLTINRYDQRQGDHIPPHVDTHSMCTDWLLSLSVGASTLMTFTRAGKGESDQDSKWKQLVHLPSRSALLLCGEARYQWRHAIAPTSLDLVPLRSTAEVNGDSTCRLALSPRVSSNSTSSSSSVRYSFTLRKVTPPGHRCQCAYPHLCDSQNSQASKSPTPPSPPSSAHLNSAEAACLEAEYVHRTYDSIAGHFSATRYGQWPAVAAFLASLPPGSLVLDVGCGNGKYLRPLGDPRLVMLGTDRSANLLSICRQRGFETFQEDVLRLQSTLRGGGGIFDGLLCIAVLHHLATEERRLAALRSLVSLLAPGTGRALIYVWAFEQRRKEDGLESRYIAKKEKKKEKQADGEASMEEKKNQVVDDQHSSLPLAVHQSGTQFRQQDLFVPWKRTAGGQKQKEEEEGVKASTSSSTALRFYHVFREGELAALLAPLSPLITIERLFYDQGNWCAVIRRK